MALAPLALALALTLAAGPSVVKVVSTGGQYSLTVDGKPFFVKGAGGDGSKTALVEMGANSFRTWGADNIEKQLDEAQKLGLKVTVGMWLAHDGDNFHYSDAAAVKKQFETCRAVIEKYRNHPAVLLWGIGNEMEGGAGDNPVIWQAVEDIAKEAKRLDPNHPTMTVVAEIGGQKLPNFNKYCPDVDILGINSYGGAPSVADRYAKGGGTKPYIVTEFGPLGQWEVGKSPWGAAYEATSTEKAAHYRESYEKAVLRSGGKCLGSYAFLWGNKMEETSTWFGMLLASGERTAAADTMQELWTGKPVKNHCPVLWELSAQQDGRDVTALLRASDPDGDPLTVKWMLTAEQTQRGSGGSFEPTPEDFAHAIVSGDLMGAKVKLPDKKGAYRLFAYVYDGKGGAAVANVPLLLQ